MVGSNSTPAGVSNVNAIHCNCGGGQWMAYNYVQKKANLG